MSKAKYPCLFDNKKQCPVCTAAGATLAGLYVDVFLEKACAKCPIRLKMIPSRKIK